MKQRDRILKYILDFGSITTKEAVVDLGILRLASRVHEMRQDMRIDDKMESGVNRYGDKVSYKRYFFKKDVELKFKAYDKAVCICVGIQDYALTRGKPYTVKDAYIHKGMPCIEISDDGLDKLIVTEDYFRRK